MDRKIKPPDKERKLNDRLKEKDMLVKSCQWWLIWYLLFFCHGGAEGKLQWVVKKKVTAYGQNLILFCPVENCCSEPAGWSVGTKSIILDVKTFSNDPKGKYHETYNKDGFGVVICNLSEADLNVTYHCVYGFDLSTSKYLLHGDVFKENVPEKDKEIDTTAAIVVSIAVTMVVIGLIIGIVAYCVNRSRIKKKRQKQTGTYEEMEVLNNSNIQMENQQGTDEKMKHLTGSEKQVQYFMDRQGILRGKCLLEDCECSQYELPADSEAHLCSYCGDPPAKHLNVQTAESEKGDKEPEGEKATQQVDMNTMKVLTKVSNSVGMFVGKIQGSCWRAGTDLIVTAWHVVHAHIREYEDLKEVKIKFDYTDSGDYDESNIFEVEPNILYHNETLDTAILRLKPKDKVKFPPPFRRLDHFLIPAENKDLTIYLIGHPDGSPQRVNLGVGPWNPTEERMQSLATFCKDEGYEYGYAELDKTERLVVKCEFEHGAAGCPGVVFLGDNQVYLVTMFLRGFPGFYWSRLFKGEKKKKFPKSKLFKQGVNIRAIYEDLKTNPKYADIFEDIFSQGN